MIYWIDLFAGAGGTTVSISKVKNTKVVACVNHDNLAIESHKANHPDVIHFVEDVRDMRVILHLKKIVQKIRREDPTALIFIWASLECINFSKAKGGQPRDADSRTLANCLFEYEDLLNPDGIFIENVEEFMSWGPLDPATGRPLSRKNGKDYVKWVNKMQSRGFKFDYKILCSADYGGVTIRKRYFAQFVRHHLEISWPEPTHSKKPQIGSLFEPLSPWRAVKEVLNFDNKGESIFKPGRIRSLKTFERIYSGLVKYVAGGDESFLTQSINGTSKIRSVDQPSQTISTCYIPTLVQPNFIVQHNGGFAKNVSRSSEDPSPTITTIPTTAVVSPEFLIQYFSNGPQTRSVELPNASVTTKDRQGLINPVFLVEFFGNSSTKSVDDPSGSITTKDKYGLIQPLFVDKQYSGSDNHASLDSPAGTVTGNNKLSLIHGQFLVNYYSAGGQTSGIDDPAGSQTTVPKSRLITVRPFLMDTNFNNTGSSVEQPSPTVLACRKHHYLVNPQYNSKGSDIDNPGFTLIARMDKAPPSLATVEEGAIGILIFPEDPEIIVKIKLFMAAYGLADIYMRMLTIPELLQIQGFPKDYILKGTQADKKKFIGNSVETTVGAAIIQATVDANLAKAVAV